MNWTELLKSEIEEKYAATEGLLQHVDEDRLDWKPATGDNWLTTGQLVLHLTNACGASIRGFATGEWGIPAEAMEDMSPEAMLPPAEKYPTAAGLDSVRNLLAEDKELALRTIDEAGEERLAGETSTAPWDPRPLRLGHRALQMVDHLSNHQSQLYYYLKLQGKPVNTMHLYGMGAGLAAE